MEKIDFSATDSVSLVTKTSRSSVVYDEEKAATEFTVLGADPYFVLDYSFNETPMQAENYTKLRITYMVPAGQSRSNYSYALFPCSGDYTSPSGTVQIYSPKGIIADGEYHTLEIDLSSYDFWGGEIHQIRFDYFNEAAEGDVFYITSFELVK